MTVYAKVNDGEEIKLCDVPAPKQELVQVSGTVELDAESLVTVTVTSAGSKDPILSWMTAEDLSPQDPDDGDDDEQKPGDGDDDEQKPGDGDDDEQKPGDGDEQKPGGDDGQKPGTGNDQKPGSGSDSADAGKDPVKTGDNSMPMLAAMIILLAISSGCVVVLLRRRFR